MVPEHRGLTEAALLQESTWAGCLNSEKEPSPLVPTGEMVDGNVT